MTFKSPITIFDILNHSRYYHARTCHTFEYFHILLNRANNYILLYYLHIIVIFCTLRILEFYFFSVSLSFVSFLYFPSSTGRILKRSGYIIPSGSMISTLSSVWLPLVHFKNLRPNYLFREQYVNHIRIEFQIYNFPFSRWQGDRLLHKSSSSRDSLLGEIREDNSGSDLVTDHLQ